MRATSFNLIAEGLGKKFYQTWLFKELNLDFSEHRQLALVGGNGSGKSTLLRLLAGQMSPSRGKVSFLRDGQSIPINQLPPFLAWSAPYLDLYPEFTLSEHLKLHFRFKNCLLPQPEDLISTLELEAHAHKPLRVYSSGMMQRVKVGMAILSDTPYLFLDEPTTNMDAHFAQLIFDLLDAHLGDRVFVLASNLTREYERVPRQLRLGKKE
ncbi:MAG: ATP-binding cassette domain-containing protein [Bacteroidota bacterium]